MSTAYDFKRLLVESGIIPREAARLYERWGALERGTADGVGSIVFDRPSQAEVEAAFAEFGNELGRLLQERPLVPHQDATLDITKKPPITIVDGKLVDEFVPHRREVTQVHEPDEQ